MYKIVTRAEIGLPDDVTSTDGSIRPVIQGCDYYTIHYTGVRVDYGDPGDTPAEILRMEEIARASNKPNEYNWVIGQDDDDFIYEYAGARRAAHSAGENSIAVGILIFNGLHEPITAKQLDKVRWMRDQILIPFKVLKPTAQTTPHKDMPGAATACPGDLIMNNWVGIMQTWAPPVVEPPRVETALEYQVQEGDSYWGIARKLKADSQPIGSFVSAIQAANYNHDLHPGAIIAIPGKVVL